VRSLEVVSQSASGCGRPKSPRAASRVLRGISRFRYDLAPCPRPSLLGLARRPFGEPLLGRRGAGQQGRGWRWFRSGVLGGPARAYG
jgi:hypothetical protein